MKKTSKKIVSKKINLDFLKSLKKVNLPVVLGGLVVAAGLFGYYKYGVVAVVNGRPIFRIEYIKIMESQVGKQTLDRMVTETLIMNEASKKGVKIDKAVVDTEIAKIEEQLKTQGQTLDSALAAEGMARTDLEKQIRLQKLAEELSAPKTEITEAEINDFLDKNKDQLPKGASKEELQTLAKTQLSSQAQNEAISTWLADLKKNAKIIYR
ncbi:MAG: SurA N-terminal domain-containing protein [Candidatus Shapirobacteria bacterium]|nr:SurA N-terminal domain-containing protein [Candidatus Shapirobacteria bacterium]